MYTDVSFLIAKDRLCGHLISPTGADEHVWQSSSPICMLTLLTGLQKRRRKKKNGHKGTLNSLAMFELLIVL